MSIFSPHVAYWVGFTAVCVLLLIFAIKLFVPWAKRHAILSFLTLPLEDSPNKAAKRVRHYVHGENKRGATEPVKAKSKSMKHSETAMLG